MTTSKTTYSALALGFLWFGAAVSIAEIYTGASMAAAPFNTTLLALLSGHLVGAIILALIAYIGFKEQRPSLMCSRLSFGIKGSWLLSILNILQLVGWTTVMIQQSGQALGKISTYFLGADYTTLSIILMGVLVALWTRWQINGRFHWNTLSVSLMFILCVVMTVSLFQQNHDLTQSMVTDPNANPMSFQVAFALSLVMPLSWAPLMADYTCRARSLAAAVIAPALGYTLGSVWMYGLGWLGALSTSAFDPSSMLLALGLGAVALGVVMLSTVTTAFLDVYSTITSTHNIKPNWSATLIGLSVVLIGTLLALVVNHEHYIGFLFTIGVVFVPMMLIVIMDYYIFKIRNYQRIIDIGAVFSLVVGILGHLILDIWFSDLVPAQLGAVAITVLTHTLVRQLLR